MPSPLPVRAFAVRHLQMARAVFAALAAAMITFTADHSAAVGLSVFSGFAIATALVLIVSAWLVYPAGDRWPVLVMGIITLIVGMIGGVVGWRSTTLFFVLVISWALATGVVELLAASSPVGGESSRDRRRAMRSSRAP